MRTLLLLVVTVAPAFAADYGTEGACAMVEAGYEPTTLTTGVVGIEDWSWYLSDAILVGPELTCDLHGEKPADCGAEGIEWKESPDITRGETSATVKLEDYDLVTLPRCP